MNTLISASGARSLDREASAHWGLDPHALVEAAGRACAEVFVNTFSHKHLSCAVLAGSGNNAADALIMLRTLIIRGYAGACTVFLTRLPAEDPSSPLSLALISVQKLGIAVKVWDDACTLAGADCIIDGIAGTGIDSPLHGAALAMTEAANSLRDGRLVVSIDMPSGNFDGWQPGMPIVHAHATLAIEPQKLCIYSPAARIHAGTILAVNGIFPPALIGQYHEVELFDWKTAASRIKPVAADAHKYRRGLVEIRAGSSGMTGAAHLAAMGAQAAGAGLVRLILDPSLYPLIAPACTGIMVVPDGETADGNRFNPAAVLMGPGWGKGEDRRRLLEMYLPREQQGLPLILDADAIDLAKDLIFHGNVLLTPHPGEFARYTGLSQDAILADPIPILRRCAAEKNAFILLKGHVLYIACPDGRVGIIDGMNPLLAAGGSGDVLAGFCAAIAARPCTAVFDGYACASAAAALLLQTAHKLAGKFADPAELANAAAAIAGEAWLQGDTYERC